MTKREINGNGNPARGLGKPKWDYRARPGSHGSAGLRELDHHYCRLIGFSVLTAFYRRVRNLPANRPERPNVPNIGPDGWKPSRPGTQSNWCSDHPQKCERATVDQGPGWIQVHYACEARHSVRGVVRAKFRQTRNVPIAGPGNGVIDEYHDGSTVDRQRFEPEQF
jgi:hypothetical protein